MKWWIFVLLAITWIGIEAKGDISIDVPTIWENDTIDLYENVTVNASLWIVNSSITFHGGYLLLRAMPNSTLFILNSTINATHNYSIFIEENVNFSFENSRFSNFGWKDLERLRNCTSGDGYTEYNRYLWIQAEFTRNINLYGNDGIVINSTAISFKNNIFENYTSIRFYSSNNTIEGNLFKGIKNEGLSFMSGSNNNTIRNNTFTSSVRMNREIDGLRFYPGTKNEKIYGNKFSYLPIAILIANIPPWDAGENFEIHDNEMERVVFGLNGKLKNSHIYNEFYNNTIQPMCIQASSNVVIENCVLSNITFQQEVEDVINQNYYNELEERDILPNMAYWMFGFYCSKIMLSLVWSGYNIDIRNNTFMNAPPYTMAINFDSARGMRNIRIHDNLFRNIGNYIPDGYKVRKDYTGYTQIDTVTPLAGCGVMLEGSDFVYVYNNVFENVLNGIATSSPDALGNFGNFSVYGNVLIGIKNFTWKEERYYGGWWSGNYTTVEKGAGIAFGMQYAVPPWYSFIERTYRANTTDVVSDNKIFNYYYPIVVDFRRIQGYAGEMGVKTAIIERNRIGKCGEGILILNDEPNVVIERRNICLLNAGIVKIIARDGWNLLTIPLHANFTASLLYDNISNCSMILKWNSSSQNFIPYMPGSPYDFPIEDGYGYFIACSNDELYVLAPIITEVNITLQEGWNCLGWFKNESTTAASIYDNISNCSMILKWNSSSQNFIPYMPGSPYNPAIHQGDGFFVAVSNECQWHD